MPRYIINISILSFISSDKFIRNVYINIFLFIDVREQQQQKNTRTRTMNWALNVIYMLELVYRKWCVKKISFSSFSINRILWLIHRKCLLLYSCQPHICWPSTIYLTFMLIKHCFYWPPCLLLLRLLSNQTRE